MRVIFVVIAGLVSFGLSDSARASLFQVDFQIAGDTTQAGFNQFLATSSQPGPTTEVFGSFSVTLTAQADGLDLGGGDFDRNQSGGIFSPLSNSGAFTYANLYNSFAFNNSTQSFAANATSSLSVVLSGSGISPLTTYSLTVYSFDSDAGRSVTTGTHHVTATGASGTTGSSSALVWSDTSRPTSNDQDSISALFTSDGSGNLTVLVSDSYTGNQDSRSGVRLNALVLNPTPEPSAFPLTLLGAASGALGLWRRRRRQSRPS
jgi:hypothetical protein